MEREQQSARSAMEREKVAAEFKRLQAENVKLKDTIVGLGAIVAEAHGAGFVRAPPGAVDA